MMGIRVIQRHVQEGLGPTGGSLPQRFPIERPTGPPTHQRPQERLKRLVVSKSGIPDIDEKSQLGALSRQVSHNVPLENADAPTRSGEFELHEFHGSRSSTQFVQRNAV